MIKCNALRWASPPLDRGTGGYSLLIVRSSKRIFSLYFEERSDDPPPLFKMRQVIFSVILSRDFSEDSDKPHVR